MPLEKGKSKQAFEHNIKAEMNAGKPMKQSLAIAYSMKKKKKMAEGGMAKGDYHSDSTSEIDPDKMAADYSSNVDMRAEADRHDRKGEPMMAEGGQIKDNYQSPSTAMHQTHETEDEQAQSFVDHEGNDQRPNGPAMSEEEKKLNQHHVPMMHLQPEDEKSMVNKIMHQKEMDYASLDRLAKGGMVDRIMCAQGADASSSSSSSAPSSPTKKDAADLDKGMDKGDSDRWAHPIDTVVNAFKYSEGGKVANQEHGPKDSRLAGFDQNEFDDLVLRDDLESSYGDDNNAGDSNDNDQENKDRSDIISRILKSRKLKDRMPNPA